MPLFLLLHTVYCQLSTAVNDILNEILWIERKNASVSRLSLKKEMILELLSDLSACSLRDNYREMSQWRFLEWSCSPHVLRNLSHSSHKMDRKMLLCRLTIEFSTWLQCVVAFFVQCVMDKLSMLQGTINFLHISIASATWTFNLLPSPWTKWKLSLDIPHTRTVANHFVWNIIFISHQMWDSKSHGGNEGCMYHAEKKIEITKTDSRYHWLVRTIWQ